MLFAILATILCGGALLIVGYRFLMIRRARFAIAQTGKPRTVALLPRSSARPGYTRGYIGRRMLISVSLPVLLFVILLIQAGPAISGTLEGVTRSLGLTLQSDASAMSNFQPLAHPAPSTASSQVKRISFHAADQFDTQDQLLNWGPSACSGISMTVVMNSYGYNVRVVDVTKKEIELGVWDSNLGLLREDGFRLTADAFGFNTDVSHSRSLADMIAIANKGTPVIVGVTDYTYFPTGHFMVLKGGDAQTIALADSSDFNFQHMSYELFLSMWDHASIILTPR